MKKTITLSLIAFSVFNVNAQLPVSTSPGKKQAILEEFSGVHCHFCPQTEVTSEQILTDNPGKVFVVHLHQSSNSSQPTGNDPDFRTAAGDTVYSIFGTTNTYLTAGLNRHDFFQGQTVLGRIFWTQSVATILSQDAYVNIAGQATLDPLTRELTVNIEAYYTANSPVATNKLTVMVLQDSINAYQDGASLNPAMVNPDGTYRHMHILRDVITNSAKGDSITTCTSGTLFTRTITYTVPASYKNTTAELANLRIVALVAETDKEIINVCNVPISISGPNAIQSQTENISQVNVYPNPANTTATLRFNLPLAESVSMIMRNELGQQVRVKNLGRFNKGEQSVVLDVAGLNNGVYFLHIVAGPNTLTKKVVLNN